MKFILFLIYVSIEAFVEMIFMRRLCNDDSMSKEDKDKSFINFAIFSALWPITIPLVLIAVNYFGAGDDGGGLEDDLP